MRQSNGCSDAMPAGRVVVLEAKRAGTETYINVVNGSEELEARFRADYTAAQRSRIQPGRCAIVLLFDSRSRR